MSKVLKEIKCKSYQDFESKTREELDDFSNYLFRGQYDAKWPLETSLHRFMERLSSISISLGDEDPFVEILALFKKMYDKRHKNRIINDINDYAGIAQHYGLPTPYLDWSYKSNIALFFAVCDEIINPTRHHNVALYALRYKNIDNLVNSNHLKELIIRKQGIKLFEEFGLYLIETNPNLDNKRVDSQNGLFLKIDGSKNQSEDVIKIFDKAYSCYSIDKPIITKFIIPRKLCKEILIDLDNRSDINFSSVYPDIDGISKQTKFQFMMNYKP